MRQNSTYNIPSLPLQQDVESKEVLKRLTKARAALAELNGITKLIPKPEILINSLTLQEAKDSSAIENIITTYDELYKADIQVGAISISTKEVQAYKNALIEGYNYVKQHGTLIINHISYIQEKIEQNNAGIRKSEGTVLKNEQTNEIIYVPPQDYKDIVAYLSNLEHYINTPDEIDPLIKLAIIHHQFESIHPFHDGNGRTGRIINILYLVLTDMLDLPILYLSGYIIKYKSQYYKLLQDVRDSGNWEARILFILDGIEKTSLATINIIKDIWGLMGENKQVMRDFAPGIYSKDLLELIFKHPYTKIDFLVRELGIVRQTASKYLQQLEKIGMLQSIQIQKEKYYINIALYNIFKKGLDFSH